VISTNGQKVDTACITSVQVLGVNKNMLVFPNPFNTQIIFTSYFETETSVELVLMDALGKIILTAREENVKGEYRKEIPTANLAQGIYFVRIKAGTENFTKKLVRE
jgi:hypothetical protein